MLIVEMWVNHNLLGLKVMQINHRQTGVVLVIDKEVFTIILAIFLCEGGVVGITKLDLFAVDVALCQYGLGLIIKAIALPWFWCEDTDIFKDTHRWNAIYDHLTALAARAEGDIFITPTCRGVGFGCRKQVLLCEATGLHHIIQRRRPR